MTEQELRKLINHEISENFFSKMFNKHEIDESLSVGFIILIIRDALWKSSKLKSIDSNLHFDIRNSTDIKLFFKSLPSRQQITKIINTKKDLIFKILKNTQRMPVEESLRNVINIITSKKIKTLQQLMQEKQLLKKLTIQLNKFLDDESKGYIKSIVKSSKTDVKVDSIYYKQIQARKKKIDAIISAIKQTQKQLVAESFQRQILLEKIDKDDYDAMIRMEKSDTEWKKLHRKLMNKYHPDKVQGDREEATLDSTDY